MEKLKAIVMVSKVDGTSPLLYAYIETLFSYAIPVTKLKQSKAKKKQVKQSKEEDLPCTFEDHVKSVEELVAFLSNHEQEALERTGKRNTNGPDMTIPRCTR